MSIIEFTMQAIRKADGHPVLVAVEEHSNRVEFVVCDGDFTDFMPPWAFERGYRDAKPLEIKR